MPAESPSIDRREQDQHPGRAGVGVPVRDRPLDLLSPVELVRLPVALVVVLLAGADDDESPRAADPGREPLVDIVLLGNGGRECTPAFRVGDDDETLTLAESCARRTPHRPDDALERLTRDRGRLVRAHHATPLEDLLELDAARIRRMIRRRVVIHGRVQGVFFRDSTRRLARQYGVTGWVANRPDGGVEAVFEGEEEAVERLVAFSRKGPRGAEVRSVEVEEEEFEELQGFSVR